MPKKDEPAVLVPEVALAMRSWQIEAMFIGMLRHRSVREEGLLVIQESYFDKLGEGYLALLMTLIRRLHAEHAEADRIPYLDLTTAALDATIPRRDGQPGIISKDEVEKLLLMPSLIHPDDKGLATWGLIYRAYHETADRDISKSGGFKRIADFVRERVRDGWTWKEQNHEQILKVKLAG